MRQGVECIIGIRYSYIETKRLIKKKTVKFIWRLWKIVTKIKN